MIRDFLVSPKWTLGQERGGSSAATKDVWRRYLKLAVPVLAWLVPTGILLAYNYAAMGSFSGYDTTNESTA